MLLPSLAHQHMDVLGPWSKPLPAGLAQVWHFVDAELPLDGFLLEETEQVIINISVIITYQLS